MNLRQAAIAVSALSVLASSLFGHFQPQAQTLTAIQPKAFADVNFSAQEGRTIAGTQLISFTRRLPELPSHPRHNDGHPTKHQQIRQPIRATRPLPKVVHDQVKPLEQRVVKGVVRKSDRKDQTKMRRAVASPAQANAGLYWLARVVEAEAGGQPQAVKIAVADVILNRVHNPLYPNSIQGVIFQQVNGVYAFSSVANGWIYHQPSSASITAAKEALYGGKNIVPTALVFYNGAETSSANWVKTRPVIAILGAMTFAH